MFSSLQNYAQRESEGSIKIYSKTANEKKLNRWLSKREWANGTNLILHKKSDLHFFYAQYKARKAWWDSAFQFIRNQPLKEMAPGKYPIIGEDVFASIAEGPSKTKEEAVWESHRKYIDFHYMIDGNEMIGLSDTTKSEVTKPYSFDAANYKTEGDFYLHDSSTFFIMSPNDVHKTNIKVDGYDRLKKLVIKIRIAEK